MQPTRLPKKKDVALQLLEQATVFVHLDPRAETVRVPPWFKRQPQLVLQIGLNMPVPIPDLQVDDEGLSCTLSFNRSPFVCVIPWGSVFALVGENRQGMIWPDDVPAEVQAQAAAQQAKPVASKPDLRVAPAPPPEPAAEEEAAAKERTPKRKRTAAAAKRPAAKARAATSASQTAKAKTPAAAKAAAPRVKARAVEKTVSAKTAAAKPTATKTQKPAPKAAPPPQPAAKAPVPRAQPAAAPQPAAAAGGGAKRKLPPYLRVVK